MPDVNKLLSKIPREFWERNKLIEMNCSNERRKNLELRTQIQIGKKDFELIMKHKSDFFRQITPLEAFGPVQPLNINHSLKTTEGRRPKREASSPLSNEMNKKPNMGDQSPLPTS